MTMFDQTTDFNNLYTAYKTAARGKHDRAEVLRHDLHAEKIIWRLQRQLRGDTYRHGRYRAFQVYDPKVRDVSAAPFTDRIVHHALVSQIEPLFERVFIHDSYACRKGKGTHAAVLRLQHYLRSAHDKYGEFYVLRADIRKFFASVDHTILLKLLSKQVDDPKTLALCAKIVDSYHEQATTDQAYTGSLRGIPIGNLTSQLFANVYLNELDQFVKRTLREPYYVRYMDDFLIIHPSKQHLHHLKQLIETFVGDKLALSLHPKKTAVHKFVGYERFVGYDAGLFVRRLSKPTVRRFMRRLKRTQATAGEDAARDSWAQFNAYASFAHAQGLLVALNPYGGDSVVSSKP